MSLVKALILVMWWLKDALAAKRSGRTTIIVAHRLSTIMDADVIIVMKVSLLQPAILSE